MCQSVTLPQFQRKADPSVIMFVANFSKIIGCVHLIIFKLFPSPLNLLYQRHLSPEDCNYLYIYGMTKLASLHTGEFDSKYVLSTQIRMC